MKFFIIDAGQEKDKTTIPLVEHVVQGIDDAGVHEIDIVRLFDKTIAGCGFCEECGSNNGLCIKDDDGLDIIRRGVNAEFIIFVVPIVDGDFTTKFANIIERFLTLSNKQLNKEGAFFVLYDNYVPEKEAQEILDRYIEYAEFANLKYRHIQKIHVDKFGGLINKDDLVKAYEAFSNFDLN